MKRHLLVLLSLLALTLGLFGVALAAPGHDRACENPGASENNPHCQDPDGDGLRNYEDPCPNDPTNSCDPTSGQGGPDDPDPPGPPPPPSPHPCHVDTDGDGIHDCIDPDDDNDGIPDSEDNCRTTPNSLQGDNDGDGKGDACDPDDDNDGIPDSSDNCPTTYNPGQEDLDGDGTGDACDGDRDGDGVPNAVDNCPDTPNDQTDSDLDGKGDACDSHDSLQALQEDVNDAAENIKEAVQDFVEEHTP